MAIGPVSTFLYCCDMAGLQIINGWASLKGCEPIATTPPAHRMQRKTWGHDWRDPIEYAFMTTWSNRRQFETLKQERADIELSFMYMRSIRDAQMRCAMEIALSGGMLTVLVVTRMRHFKSLPQRMKYRCGEPDTKLHCCWQGPLTEDPRQGIGCDISILPVLTH